MRTTYQVDGVEFGLRSVLFVVWSTNINCANEKKLEIDTLRILGAIDWGGVGGVLLTTFRMLALNRFTVFVLFKCPFPKGM